MHHPRFLRTTAVAAAAVHIALLAAYTFPEQVVPTRLRYWSQAYARVLFHQDWRLFAPDPPACSCSIEFRTGAGAWRELEVLHHHFVWRRMAANACRYAEQTGVTGGPDRMMPDALAISLMNMTGDRGRDLHEYRLDRRGGTCVAEFTPLHLRPARE